MRKIETTVNWWVLFGLPAPATEYKFLTDRRFRFDWAWPAHKIAVEQEGGIWIPGRSGFGGAHAMPTNIIRDMEKQNLAGLHGWRVFRFQPREIVKGTAQAFMIKVFETILVES